MSAESGGLLRNNNSQTDIHSRKTSFIESQEDTVAAMHQTETEQEQLEDAIEGETHGNRRRFITESRVQLGVCILGWYVFSLSISLYNKWMFDKSSLNLPFPVLITSFHQLLLSLLSFLTIMLRPRIRSKDDQFNINNSINSKDYWMFYALKILPCAISSAGDIGSGNMSFRFITLSTYTLVKSSAIAFVLFFGVLFKLEKFSLNLLGIVLLMVVGVMLMVDHNSSTSDATKEERDHYYLGFGLVLMSACMSGLRWVFTQLLLYQNEDNSKSKKKKNPILTIYQLSPSMFLLLFTIGSGLEGIGNFVRSPIWVEKGIFTSTVLLIFPGFLVFFMTIFEFAILQRAQVITLSIAGIFKELLTILVSTIVFKDKLTFKNYIGLIITLIDIVWYNYYRYIERVEEGIRLNKKSFQLESISQET